MNATLLQEIALTKVERNPNQPRETFPDDHIRQLAASIKEQGLIQPITVRPIDGGRFQIVAGECRYRAHQLLGRETVRAIVQPMSDDEMRLRAIIENLQRRDMNPIEEARAFKTLVDSGRTIRQIVEQLGLKSDSIVKQRLDLLDLPANYQQLVATGNLSPSMAWALTLCPREHQARLMRDISSGKLRTLEQVRHAGIAIRDATEQIDAFGNVRVASNADLRVVSNLESRVDAIASMVQAGFKDGECVAAQRVSPDRVTLMVEKLVLIRKHILIMEHDLRRAATHAQIATELAL